MRTFSVKGRIAFANGESAQGIYVAVADADPELDDLLGVGVTNATGEFACTFTTEAFNQEADEAEELPDLYVVASLDHEGFYVPVVRREFPGLRFASVEDLGTIVLPLARGEAPTRLEGVRPAPGMTKLVRRIALDDGVVRYAAETVAPLVERLTGFRDLLDGTRLTIVDSFGDVQRRRVAHLRSKSDLDAAELLEAAERATGCDVATFALWEHHERTIFLNRTILEAQNLDALRVTIGHELVHVGQSRMYPELDAQIEIAQSEGLAHFLAGSERAPERMQVVAHLMANLEGYAAYVEEILLSFFTHGATIWGAGLAARGRIADRGARELDAKARSFEDILRGDALKKQNQYRAGREAYEARARAAGGAVPFDPTLRPELRASKEAIAQLEEHAMKGGPAAQLRLGVALSHGQDGVPRDLDAARRLLRLAADGGNAVASFLLSGKRFGADDAERAERLRASADQGYAPAQRSYAETLLATDAPQAIALLEKAAEQGEVDAMRRLAELYEKGAVVPRDIVKARMWTNRANRAGAAK